MTGHDNDDALLSISNNDDDDDFSFNHDIDRIKKEIWNHPMYADASKCQAEYDNYILNPFEVVEGVLDCLKCKSRRVFSTSIQNRAADEPLTTVAKCAQCGYRWTQNG